MSIRETFGWEKYLRPFLYKPLPAKTGWSAVIGTLAALTFLILVVTGMLLAFYYVPSPDKAWESVQYITNELPAGHLVRGLHHWSAGIMVLLVFIHQLVAYFHGAYKRPRRATWITGCCLFLVTLGFGFTGYLLPWDMKAYWATIVGTNIPSQYPLIGESITHFILGGPGMSGFTLSRFYSIHTLILPALMLLFVALHIYLIRVHNLSDPRERLAGEALPPETGAPYRFFPEHMYRTAIAFGILFLVLLVLAVNNAGHIDPKAGTFIADYLPRPEWYYMWLFQLLTYFTGPWEMVGSLVLPIGGIILMFAVPYMSESQMKGIKNRPTSLTLGATFIICLVYLTSMAYSDAAPYNKVSVKPSQTMTAEQTRGMQLFAEHQCSYCHNIMGVGGHRTGPDMSNMKAKNRTADYLAAYIKDPKAKMASTTMPSYAFKDNELQDLAAYILSLDFHNGNHPVFVNTEDILRNSRSQQF